MFTVDEGSDPLWYVSGTQPHSLGFIGGGGFINDVFGMLECMYVLTQLKVRAHWVQRDLDLIGE